MVKPPNMSPAAQAALAVQQKEREARLAKALRANLRRRKAPAASAAGDPDSADSETN